MLLEVIVVRHFAQNAVGDFVAAKASNFSKAQQPSTGSITATFGQQNFYKFQ
jgi:hypothetical protein